MTQSNTAEAKAQVLLLEVEQEHAIHMPKNFRSIAIKAIVAAMAQVVRPIPETNGNQRPVLMLNGRPIPDAAREAFADVMGRSLFKFADAVKALADNGITMEGRAAEKLADRLMVQYRRRGLVVSAGTRGYWQASGNPRADTPAIPQDGEPNSLEAELLRKALIEAASDFHLIALHGDMQSMFQDAKAGRDRVLNALVTAA